MDASGRDGKGKESKGHGNKMFMVDHEESKGHDDSHHVSGASASLDEKGYKAVAKLKNQKQMMTFIKRIIDDRGLYLVDEGALTGIVPYYSGAKATQTFTALNDEIDKSLKKKKKCWVCDKKPKKEKKEVVSEKPKTLDEEAQGTPGALSALKPFKPRKKATMKELRDALPDPTTTPEPAEDPAQREAAERAFKEESGEPPQLQIHGIESESGEPPQLDMKLELESGEPPQLDSELPVDSSQPASDTLVSEPEPSQQESKAGEASRPSFGGHVGLLDAKRRVVQTKSHATSSTMSGWIAGAIGIAGRQALYWFGARVTLVACVGSLLFGLFLHKESAEVVRAANAESPQYVAAYAQDGQLVDKLPGAGHSCLLQSCRTGTASLGTWTDAGSGGTQTVA